MENSIKKGIVTVCQSIRTMETKYPTSPVAFKAAFLRVGNSQHFRYFKLEIFCRLNRHFQ